MPAPFSRLQLAAALIEYDNDPDNVNGKNRSAQDSAIFAHFRRNPAARPNIHTRHSNHLGVSLPNEGTQDGRESAMGTRRSRGSRGSLDALRNPFGTDSMYDEEQEEEPAANLEVDLSSWGLDQFIPKEKTKSKGKQKQSPAPTLAAVSSRTISGGPNEYGELPAGMTQSNSLNSLGIRRQSTSSKMALGEDTTNQHRQRAASQSTLPPNNLEGVPFPSGRRSPGYDQIGQQPHHIPRSQSRTSIGTRGLLDEFNDDEDPDRQRTFSQGTLDQLDNPFALQPPPHTSRFDPKAPVHARTISQGSLGSRGLLEIYDAASTKSHDSFPRDRPYSVVELLRPKVLVMPSPLQPVGPQTEDNQARDGWKPSKDGPPLPPGARPMGRRLSMNLDAVPNPSNSFIPNPAADLSYAQKIFRSTLVAGNSGGIDAESTLPRAMEDGEQVEFEPIPPGEDEHLLYGISGQPKPARPAGKLFGKSLIDDLESRKQAMRNKQRVFRGDQRPSMMARESNRTSTFIDPATLNDRPNAKRNSSYGSQGAQNALGRHPSIKPLLNFDGDNRIPQTPLSPEVDRIANSKSVFGVDTLWEKEMVKLRALQEQERIDEEARTKAEEEEARQKAEKEKKKRKKKKNQVIEEKDLDQPRVDAVAEPRVSLEPPVLPDIKPTIHRTMPKVEDHEDSDDSDDNDDDGQILQHTETSVAWHSDSEGEALPRRTTGVGLRNPQAVQPRRAQVRHDSDSEEDLPLNVARQRVAIRTTKFVDDSDEDEDKPLAQVLREPNLKSSTLNIDFDNFNVRGGGDSDDEQPLGLRASRAILSQPEDDDKPLAFHPEQQRRTQYQLFAAAQQQQHQSMMMQAQFQNSMFFNQPMMASPYFAPPMMNPMAMMQPPMSVPSPPPIQDQSKFSSVDRWRRDVAIDGDR